ncbi:glycosyltransferase [Arhodomonas sp. AD133]|uniref:glycosyltransferase n=1 Tax=Arhodomonas sp. AD133 TaxID=3415009 RepID=UPI003EB6B487
MCDVVLPAAVRHLVALLPTWATYSEVTGTMETNNGEPASGDNAVVMACTHPYWSARQVGSQHLARQFARRGWKVYYLSAAVTPFHMARIAAPEVSQRVRTACSSPTRHEGGAIESYVPFAVVAPDGRPFLRAPITSRHWWRTLLPQVRRRLRGNVLRHESTLLYIDNLSYGWLLDWLPYDYSVFRVMDDHERFPGWQGRAHGLARDIAQKVDLTVYSAATLADYVDSLNPCKAALVPNGVDVDAFSGRQCTRTIPDAIRRVKRPLVLYTGAIDDRVDLDTIARAARRLPHVSFVMMGPRDVSSRGMSLPENVVFTGHVAHEQLPACMQHAVAGIVPFRGAADEPHALRGVRPLKMLEYLAAGLPVISASWAETEAEDIPVWRYRNVDDLVALVERALTHSHDPSAGRRYAERYDWNGQLGRILAALNLA